MQDAPGRLFASYHPALRFGFCALALLMCFCSLQPICVAVSLFAAACNLAFLDGWRKLLRQLVWLLPLMLLAMAANGLFAGLGATTLFTVGGMQVTLEACAFGLSAGSMLGAVILWFACYQALMDRDSFLYLFGNILPMSSLVLTMVIRLMPQLLEKGRDIRVAQEALLGAETGALRDRTKRAGRLAGTLMSISMEDSIAMADSMKARGWGSGERSSYSRYHWGRGDSVLAVVLGGAALICGFLVFVASSQWEFYPVLPRLLPWWGYLPYLLFLLTPIWVELAATGAAARDGSSLRNPQPGTVLFCGGASPLAVSARKNRPRLREGVESDD